MEQLAAPGIGERRGKEFYAADVGVNPAPEEGGKGIRIVAGVRIGCADKSRRARGERAHRLYVLAAQDITRRNRRH